MSVSKDDEVAKNELLRLPSEYLLQMNEFRKENKFCDVIIVIDDTKFPCHRNVLAAASKFFNKMFGGQYEESERKEIKMDSVSVNCFENVLEFIYCQQMDINPNNSFELLSASRFFDFNAMEGYCSMYVMEHIPEKYVFETCTFAELSNKKQLYDDVLRYIAKNFANVCDQPAFLEVSYDILRDIVGHFELDCSHEVMLQSIIRWTDGKNVKVNQMRNLFANLSIGDYMAKLICAGDVRRLLTSRSEDEDNMDNICTQTVGSLRGNALSSIARNFSQLCSSDLFLEIPYDFLETVITHPHLNSSVDDVIKCIALWKQNQLMISKDKVQKLLSYVLRRGNVNQISIDWSKKLVCCAGEMLRLYVRAVTYPNYDVVELIYDEESEKWQRNEQYSNKACFEKSVVMNGRIFRLSVNDSRIVKFQVKKSDTVYRDLKLPPVTPLGRCNMAAADDTIFLYTIESWPDIECDSKKLLRVEYSVYSTSRLVFAYVYALNDWFLVHKQICNSNNEVPYKMCLTTRNEQFYLVGGEKKVLFYSSGGYWSNSSNTWYSHINGAACSHNGKLYVFGGESNVLEAYDPKTRRWEVLQSAKYDRSYHLLVSYRNKLWAIGSTNDLPTECYNPVTNIWTCMKSLPIDYNARIVDAFVL